MGELQPATKGLRFMKTGGRGGKKGNQRVVVEKNNLPGEGR